MVNCITIVLFIIAFTHQSITSAFMHSIRLTDFPIGGYKYSV